VHRVDRSGIGFKLAGRAQRTNFPAEWDDPIATLNQDPQAVMSRRSLSQSRAAGRGRDKALHHAQIAGAEGRMRRALQPRRRICLSQGAICLVKGGQGSEPAKLSATMRA
jgi:hypothetical protein